MMQPNGAIDLNTMLPLMMINDSDVDMKSLFMMTTMMQANCDDTNEQLNSLMPLLVLSEDDDTDSDNDDEKLKTLLLMQTMSQVL